MSKLDNISLSSFKKVYFLGIGGIGMSALAKYFLAEGFEVGGYDKTPSSITENLNELGAEIHFEDLGKNIPNKYSNKEETLVIRTPAVPVDFSELLFFQKHDFSLFKRSEILGILTRNYKGLGVAGTHGKTTTSCLLAHMLNESDLKCNAFLGGISSNFNTNYIGQPNAEYTVIEADEFDRSFLQLKPFASIITAMDADHLDIYGTVENFQKGFFDYAALIEPNGLLVSHYGLPISTEAEQYTYDVNNDLADFNITNLRFENEQFLFTVHGPNFIWENVELGIPGIHNAENALACIILCLYLDLDEEIIRHGLKTFKGVKRRFDYHIRSNDLVYIDDYAHHPTEIKALLDSIELLYPNRKITGVFQPHLFTRTRDFFDGFVEQLSRLDECILLPIYPAREIPIEGITSDQLLEKITAPKKRLMSAVDIPAYTKSLSNTVLLTIGAGDIDRIVEPIKKARTQ
jgi:UDP-N-acetylmuramate--alanine ligase